MTTSRALLAAQKRGARIYHGDTEVEYRPRWKADRKPWITAEYMGQILLAIHRYTAAECTVVEPPSGGGPFGPEGYCRDCHRVVALSDVGSTLIRHTKGTHQGNACPGSFGRPAPIPVGEVAAAAFSEIPRRAECPVCHAVVNLAPSGRSFGRHLNGVPLTVCTGTGLEVERVPETLLPPPSLVRAYEANPFVRHTDTQA